MQVKVYGDLPEKVYLAKKFRFTVFLFFVEYLQGAVGQERVNSQGSFSLKKHPEKLLLTSERFCGLLCREVIPMLLYAKQASMPQVLISNPMRRKFNQQEINVVTAQASDRSLA